MNKIYIGNLPFTTTEELLNEVFQEFGKITETALIRDRQTGNLKGFGFVTYASAEEAEKSLVMDGKEFGGRKIVVNIAKERVDRPRPPRGGSGRSGGGRNGGGGNGGGGRRDSRW